MTDPAAVPPARLLVVDDEAAQLKALCETLRDNGYDTTGFSSPREALAAAGAGKFDLVLTDLQMPEMDGIAFMRRLFELDRDMVAIMMTGHGTMDTAVEALRLGAFDYIQKPFKLAVVMPALERALAVGRLRRENATLVRNLRERSEQLEAANHELEAFSYSVAHDLRTPLRAVNGFASILEETYASEWSADARSLLHKVKIGATSMGQLIDALLRLSRIGRQPMMVRPVRMSSVVTEVLEELRESHAGRNIVFSVADLPDAMGDMALIRQVLLNLLGNAIKFTRKRDPGRVEVGSTRQGSEQVYFVRDNGAGFDMKYAQQLFGVFQRMHAATDFEGTGVGLSIVQRVVKRCGGRVWAEAEPNVGASFFFALPVVEENRG